VESFEILKEQFLEMFTSREKVSESLVFNWDQTAIKYASVSNWIMEKKGTKKVRLARLDEKSQFLLQEIFCHLNFI